MNTTSQTKPEDSYIEIFNGGVAMVGPDAVEMFRAIQLKSALKFYLKTGMLPTHGVTGPKMLLLATSITKQPYDGNGKYDRALGDLHNWIETMKCGMPIRENGKPI